MTNILRRRLLTTAFSAGLLLTGAAFAGLAPAGAAEKMVTIGINLPLTGADAESATRIK